ncbi:MAG: hypothetical protein U1E50_09275 [Caulobacteraceae bacterium]
MAGQGKQQSRFVRALGASIATVRADAGFFGLVWLGYGAAEFALSKLPHAGIGPGTTLVLWPVLAKVSVEVLVFAALNAAVGARLRAGPDSEIGEVLQQALRLAPRMTMIMGVLGLPTILATIAVMLLYPLGPRLVPFITLAGWVIRWMIFLAFGLAPALLAMRERGIAVSLFASERLLRGNRVLTFSVVFVLDAAQQLLGLPVTLPSISQRFGLPFAGEVLAEDGGAVYLIAIAGLYAVLYAVALWYLAEIFGGRRETSDQTADVFS